MKLTERLASLGVTQEDIELVESSINEQAEKLAEAKAQTLVEAEMSAINEAVASKVEGFKAKLQESAKVAADGIEQKYKETFEAEANTIVEKFKASFNEYSEVLIEKAKGTPLNQSDLKVAMAEELLEAAMNVFKEYNVEMPEKVNFEEEMNKHLTSLEESLNTVQKENDALKSQILEGTKAKIKDAVTAGLSVKQKETFEELSESVLFVDEELYTARLTKIAESISTKKEEKPSENLNEGVKGSEVPSKPNMDKYLEALRKK